MVVDTGTLSIQDPVSGTGVFDIDGSVVLDFANQVTGDAQVSFVGAGGTLAVDNPGTLFGGSVAGFDVGDTIDFSSGTIHAEPHAHLQHRDGWMVDDGMHSESIPLLGSYTNLSFQPISDGHGGTAVVHT